MNAARGASLQSWLRDMAITGARYDIQVVRFLKTVRGGRVRKRCASFKSAPDKLGNKLWMMRKVSVHYDHKAPSAELQSMNVCGP